MKKTTFTKTVTESCEKRITALSCGCVETAPVKISDTPVREDQPVCEVCSKYHAYETEQKVFQDCSTHVSFFQRWPAIGRSYFTDKCPQFGIDPSEAKMMLNWELPDRLGDRKQVTWSDDQRQELVNVIAAATDKYASSRATMATLNQNLTPAQHNQLAMAVTKATFAEELLEANLLGNNVVTGPARRHLQLVVVRRQAVCWGIRLAATAIAIAALTWHLPDWRTILTLSAIGAAVCVFLENPSDWFEKL